MRRSGVVDADPTWGGYADVEQSTFYHSSLIIFCHINQLRTVGGFRVCFDSRNWKYKKYSRAVKSYITDLVSFVDLVLPTATRQWINS